MEFNLTTLFPHARGYYPNKPLEYPVEQHDTPFVLSDSKACQECEFAQNVNPCNQIILNIETDSKVTVLHFEEFVSQIDNTPAALGKRCDYLIYDEDENKKRIAFCELTCSSKEYVNPTKRFVGKRAIAHEQLQNSIEALLSVQPLDVEVLTYPQKVAIFGWRERILNNYVDQATEAMDTFSITPDSEASVLIANESIMRHNFKFLQIKYPTPFMW